MELNGVYYINSNVIKSTEWVDIQKYEKLEGDAGVFIFSNFIFQVKYVGRAGMGSMVSEISEAIRNGKSAGSTKVKVIYTASEKQAVALEKKLILRYHPVYNLK